MIHQLFYPSLLATGPACGNVFAVRVGLVNFYVIPANRGCICIDTGWRPASSTRGLAELGFTANDVQAVFLTHLHWDHARGARAFPHAEIFAGEHESLPRPARWSNAAPFWTKVRDQQHCEVNGVSVSVIATPGHTAGSTSYIANDHYLFTGDALRLRQGKVVQFPPLFNHDNTAARSSLRKLAACPGVKYILTPHTGISDNPAAAFRLWTAPQKETRA